MSDTHTEILERLQARDALLFGLSDTLDVKASIALVVITFLATQTADFLVTDQVPFALRYVQMGATFILAAAGGVALVSLWPRDHAVETAEQLDAWAQQLREFYRDDPYPEEAVAREFQRGRILRLTERIAINDRLDREKSTLVTVTYALTGVAVILNLSTLIGMALR